MKAFEAEIEAMRSPAKDFADDIFENLFGAKTLDYSLPEVLEPTTGVAKKVKTPDDEEELVYTPTDEDRLDNEDDEDGYDMEVTTTTVKAAQDDRPQRNDNRSQQGRDTRPQGGNQGNRNNQGPRQPQQNRGPNPNQGQGQGQDAAGKTPGFRWIHMLGLRRRHSSGAARHGQNSMRPLPVRLGDTP